MFKSRKCPTDKRFVLVEKIQFDEGVRKTSLATLWFEGKPLLYKAELEMILIYQNLSLGTKDWIKQFDPILNRDGGWFDDTPELDESDREAYLDIQRTPLSKVHLDKAPIVPLSPREISVDIDAEVTKAFNKYTHKVAMGATLRAKILVTALRRTTDPGKADEVVWHLMKPIVYEAMKQKKREKGVMKKSAKSKRKKSLNPVAEVKAKYIIVVKFDSKEIDGKKSDFVEMKMKTKAVTYDQAFKIMKAEADSIWPKYEFTIKPA